MTISNRLSIALFAFLLVAFNASAQINNLTATITSSAALATDRILNVASATGINAPGNSVVTSQLYVVSPGNPRGEVMLVQAVSGTAITVSRGSQGASTAIPSGSTVLIGQPNWFYSFDPSGGCTTATVYASPAVNTKTGAQWVCSSVTLSWVPSWNADISAVAPTAAVASAAGLITPSGPLFHVSGTAAITGFNIPVGLTGGIFTIIPDGAFTTTTANNIAFATTALVGKRIVYSYDPITGKFYPSY